MPEPDRRRPRVATCEDWDEDAQTTRPGTQTTANVSAKRSDQDLVPRQRGTTEFYVDGGDSGYASRAATTVSQSTSSSRRRMPDLKLDTAGIRERERHPYLYSQTAVPKPPTRRQSSSQSKEPSPEKRPTRGRDDLPERGYPDNYTKHSEPKQAARVAHPPHSPVAVKREVTKSAKDDLSATIKSRKPSTNQLPRPVSMLPQNAPMPIQYAMYPAYPHPGIATSGYATPVTPSGPYGSIPFSYAPPPPLPTPSYAAYLPPPSYFDQLPEPRSARPSRHPSPVRRASTYGEPVINQGQSDSAMKSLERMPSKESRPALPSHRSARSIEVDRGQMLPPPRPQQPEVVLGRRPSTRRSQTYHPQEPTVRERVVFEPDQYESDEDRDYNHIRAAPPSTFRERRESSSRPPSSYRPPTHVEPRDRPPARKSVSYSAGTTVTKVASSSSHAMPRRMTVPLEQKEAEVEEYQTKRNNAAAAASGLTVEALRKLDQRTSSSKSETGSNFSHQSSSKDSSGRDRSQTAGGTKTSITLPGGMNVTIPEGYMSRDGRPLSINIGGLVVSVAAEGKENERPKEQKRIERAPSVASRTSKRSAASSVVSNSRGRDMPPPASRRPSQLEDRVPTSVRSSRQPSRAPSMNRGSHDYSSKRQSVDYSREIDYNREYDDFYAAG
ncbi:hypothetical protein G647_08469 [Cladophialophora carrionii CBS 160.54]|uniref:Uncharacterized protein n=1 Tax=Cladophialophora carrionii CBS 160.54 TaxID=1279043 RepID=V9D0J6_9EURO|nr:uncharacterized protein G647_08469 [Cladophialophora carrionii CBS 160.54]ETI20434.1 hypothetical protein G647_08469 [Cladophialophora carrionii CBS 160.54]